MIQPQNKNHLIHLSIALVALFFCFRELGTFPSAWLDDSLFMLVAQSVVRGDGYSLPMLWEHWNYPFVLAVGPTVILPSSLSMSILGESVAAARIPAAMYTLATAVAVYFFARRRGGVANAQIAALLLITLSAFVNTGKPLLGEVPSIFYLFAGLLLLDNTDNMRKAVVTGLVLGLAVVSKLTLGLIFPALGVAFIAILIQKRKPEAYRLIVISLVAFAVFIVWQLVEIRSNPGGLEELRYYGFADNGSLFLQLLKTNPAHLLRFPFLYFGTLFFFAGVGIHRVRDTLRNGATPFLITLTLLFCVYFLNGPGWYRHLLTAHVLLLPFAPIGIWTLLGKRLGTALLLFFMLAQGWWQATYHGSTRSPEAKEAAAFVLDSSYEQIVIENPEVYFRLPESDRFLFVSREFIRTYLDFGLPLEQTEHCLPVVRKVGWSERDAYEDRLIPVAWRFVIIKPEEGCTQ